MVHGELWWITATERLRTHRPFSAGYARVLDSSEWRLRDGRWQGIKVPKW